MGFNEDFAWQRRLLPRVKQILAEYLIAEAGEIEDRYHNTDLIVLKIEMIRVACRLRQHGFLWIGNYRNEFTVRSGRPNGTQTELQKILSGWGDYFFYGFATPDGRGLAAYFLGDLNVFRLWFNQQLYEGRRPWEEKSNKDGSARFLAFRVADLPRRFVVARSAPGELAA